MADSSLLQALALVSPVVVVILISLSCALPLPLHVCQDRRHWRPGLGKYANKKQLQRASVEASIRDDGSGSCTTIVSHSNNSISISICMCHCLFAIAIAILLQ